MGVFIKNTNCVRVMEHLLTSCDSFVYKNCLEKVGFLVKVVEFSIHVQQAIFFVRFFFLFGSWRRKP